MAGIELKLFKMTNTEYQRGVAIDNYNGTVSLVGAKQNDKGIWKDWVYPQKYVDGSNVPGEKSIPLKVELGKGKAESIATLQYFIDVLNGTAPEPDNYSDQNLQSGNVEPPEDDPSDIPF